MNYLYRFVSFCCLSLPLYSQASKQENEQPDNEPFYQTVYRDFIDNSFYDDKGIVVTYTGRTYHLSSRDRNENNQIMGLGYKGFEISTMNNSFYNRSYMFSYHKKWPLNDWADLGFRLGGITGYSKEDNSVQLFGITPLISPTITFHYKGFGFETALQTDVFIFTLNYQF
ncbi:hypothetical protein FR932_02410 [Moritella marina ATCC 15381]|uniref:Sn-glycerol-3-phosphate transporter n=1 Tax=Moritella marina ATCC 15381 TaxID=1202962 RepID=A0A5J6WGX2_MORMI|nr:hypothetical protein [Moritella marina]QFI36764.1 hypothetical protein FR932_02410 [Moritella marina ATCC 15381]